MAATSPCVDEAIAADPKRIVISSLGFYRYGIAQEILHEGVRPEKCPHGAFGKSELLRRQKDSNGTSRTLGDVRLESAKTAKADLSSVVVQASRWQMAIASAQHRFLAAPSLAAAAYGVPAGTEPHSRAYLSAKGIRDIASGLFIAILIAHGSAHPLGWFMLAATIIPIGDAAIVLHQGGSRATAFGIHGSTAAVMLIISGLLLFG